MFVDPGLILEEASPREASSLLRAEVLFVDVRCCRHFAPQGLKNANDFSSVFRV